ncbi:e28abdca-f6fe-42a6-8672-63d7d521d736 [Thermothielavioides terrestris]|uniref:E28abdca-f6fe-42a6-8672-63d7d521d736 n=1 Tax=Thermothielavioides terrestris TaxID=2587410 RepID=A0A3S4D5R8_9PEZI|nr:e28abdca-f6fe-42a6-8672-63d7d521d736 [Thermothielavioides terrestris]
MAAPPVQAHWSTATSPLQGEQPQGQQAVESHEVDSENADLDSAVAGQLIARTSSLTISGPRSDAEGCPVPRDSRDTLDVACDEIPRSPIPPLSTDAQPHPATLRDEWQDPWGTEQADAVALASSSCTSMLEKPCKEELQTLSLAPYLHQARLRRTRAVLPPLLTSPARPSLADLARRSIFLTRTAFASRKLARSLASIRLARRLAARPSAESLVARCVLPPECVPRAAATSGGGGGHGGGGATLVLAPALVARKRAVEREKVKDGLRAWVGSVWKRQVRLREEGE